MTEDVRGWNGSREHVRGREREGRIGNNTSVKEGGSAKEEKQHLQVKLSK